MPTSFASDRDGDDGAAPVFPADKVTIRELGCFTADKNLPKMGIDVMRWRGRGPIHGFIRGILDTRSPTSDEDAALGALPPTFGGGDTDLARSRDLHREEKPLTFVDIDRARALNSTVGNSIFVQKSSATSALDISGEHAIGASSSLATASTELENLRSPYQELETKLKEAELKREQAEKQLAEKNSEHIREKGELELKKNADSETIRKQQKELNGLRKFMETAEQHWDLLNENILEPLGYPEQRRNLFPRDDLLQLAGDDCKDLISASRKICHNLNIKRSRTCDVRKLIGKMDVLPELVTDLQASSARGAAAMALTMCLAHTPGLDLDEVTTGVPPDADVGELLDAVSGYDTRIARRIRHEEFYDKVVLAADEPLEAELLKDLDAQARPAESGAEFTWTSSKDAPQEEPKTSTAASEEKESEEDVSSPAEGAKEQDPEDKTSPAKGE
ncbi:uncharacterized protein [Lolium perenne]|uniref:uncharacterized protein n=1 Tax=Lolium perenne TaxID=4522 RepID=UPI003A997272